VLLTGAVESVSRFLAARENNLKYAGIDALTRLVRIDPKHAQVGGAGWDWLGGCVELGGWVGGAAVLCAAAASSVVIVAADLLGRASHYSMESTGLFPSTSGLILP
jgi:hypothetical protein